MKIVFLKRLSAGGIQVDSARSWVKPWACGSTSGRFTFRCGKCLAALSVFASPSARWTMVYVSTHRPKV